MWEPVVWALLTGGVTGAVWFGIVLVQRQHRVARRQPELLEDLRERIGQLEETGQRLTEVEERLDFAERRLIEQREPDRLPPGSP